MLETPARPRSLSTCGRLAALCLAGLVLPGCVAAFGNDGWNESHIQHGTHSEDGLWSLSGYDSLSDEEADARLRQLEARIAALEAQLAARRAAAAAPPKSAR